jgi:hypothetical protein
MEIGIPPGGVGVGNRRDGFLALRLFPDHDLRTVPGPASRNLLVF